MRAGRSVGLFLLLPALVSAHTGEPLRPDDLWSAWEFDPGVVIPLVSTAVLYALGTRRHFGQTNLQKLCFWTGWLSLVLALNSPIHPLGEVLFSAHMVQHEILMLVSAPLLVLSRPLVTFLWALPMNWRKALGARSKQGYVKRSWNLLTEPFTAWGMHAAAIWIWHAPALFQLTLKSDLAHTAQHLRFFLSGLLFWWAVFYAKGRGAYGAAFSSSSRPPRTLVSWALFSRSRRTSGIPPTAQLPKPGA